MKLLRSLLTLALIALLLPLAAQSATAEPAPKRISLVKSQIIAKNARIILEPTLKPAGCSRELIWTSSDESIATVSATGKVTAKAVGSTTIRAASAVNPAVFAKCKVKVSAKTAMDYNPKKGNFKAGGKNVYGVRLRQSDLNKLKAEIERIVPQLIKPGMRDFEKLNALADYLTTKTTYQDWRKHRYNNTACGPLLRGKGACSGYARALKALCDAAGLPCYYVHATFRDHQWNMVRLDGIWFHVDAQKDDAYSGSAPGGVAFLPGEAHPFNLYSSSLPPTYYDLGYPNGDPSRPVLYYADEYDHYDDVGETYSFETAPRY